MVDYAVGNTVVVHKDDFTYTSHPSIALLSDRRWIAAFAHSRRRQRREHPPGDPLFRNILSRTSDRGETWEEPYFAPDFDWYGVETPGVAVLSDGTVVLTQYRFGWYPLGLAKKRRAAGEPISISLPRRRWTEDFTDDEWDDSIYPWARGYHGLYAHLSSDNGDTFETVKLDSGPYLDGFTRVGVVELSDGRVAYSVTEHHPTACRHTYLLVSHTRGRTWDPPVIMVDSPDLYFSEPHIAEVAPGEIYGILRTEPRENLGGYLYGCRSLDGGATWSAPDRTPMFGHPGHLQVLHDGRLLCTYGRRTAPFGIRASLSEDGGRTWQTEREIIVRDDLPNGDLGYPTTIEYEPGHLFVCYYGQVPDGVTCIQGTYLTLTS
jgi:hypothetical protein